MKTGGVSKWKSKNRIYETIQHKMEILKDEYGLSEHDVADDLFRNYWERGHYKKYDESRGSLNNWIAGYVCLYLNHMLRRCSVRKKNKINQRIDPLDQRNQANLVWIDKDNGRDDPDYQPEIIIDTTDPEDLCIAKETLDFVYGHFSKTETEYLMGEIGLDEAAGLEGTTCDAFRKRLERRKADFKTALKMANLD